MRKFAHPSLRKLEGVIVKLEPLSEQHVLLKFLRNADDTKTLVGFVQELADAVVDYQVRVTCPPVVFVNAWPGFNPTGNIPEGGGYR